MGEIVMMKEAPGPPETKWKKGRPLERAFVVAGGEWPEPEILVLCHIGPGLDYWSESVSELDDRDMGLERPLGPGFWIWEGKVHVSGGEGMFPLDEREEELSGTYRKATTEEVKLYREEGCAWDYSEWVEDPPECTDHVWGEPYCQKCFVRKPDEGPY
jgi:hypothetical protein